MTTDDFGSTVYPGSIANGEIDTEYSPRICAQDEHYATKAEVTALTADTWAVIDELEARIAKLEAAQPKPLGDAYAHIPIAEWLDFKEELEAARVRLAELSAWAADANTYISAAGDAMCEEMDAQPADKIFDGPLWKALSSAGDIGIRGLLEHYGELQRGREGGE